MSVEVKNFKHAKEKKIKNRRCYECRNDMAGVIENYKYAESGLSNVVLQNIVVYHCKSCGAIVPEIPGMAALHRLILMDLITKKTLLVGEEIKFLRKMGGLSAAELSRVLDIHPTTLSDWERGANAFGKEADRVLRLYSFSRMLQEVICETKLAPIVVQVARKYSEFDIHTMLKMIQDISEGPKDVRIDPSKLNEFSCLMPEAELTIQ